MHTAGTAQAGQRYVGKDTERPSMLTFSAMDMLPVAASSPSSTQREAWQLYAVRAPGLPLIARSARALVFRTPDGALGGRVAAGQRFKSVRAKVADRLWPLYFSLQACDAVSNTAERCDAVMDWGMRGALPPLLPEQLPLSPGGLATALELGVRLVPMRAPKWPAANLRAFLRPVGPGLFVGAAFRGAAAEPAFTFLMLRTEELMQIDEELATAMAVLERELDAANLRKLNSELTG